MSIARVGSVFRNTVVNVARRRFSSSGEQVFRNNPVVDENYMFKPKSWIKYYEILPLLTCVGFAGGICLVYCFYSLFKEDCRVANNNTLASYENYSEPHRYKAFNLHKDKPLPPEIAQLKKELGPYTVRGPMDE